MKDLLGIANNVTMPVFDGRVSDPRAEIVLILSEPEYSCDHAGQLSKHRVVSSFRFSAGIDAMEKVIDGLQKLLDELKAIKGIADAKLTKQEGGK